MAGDAGPERSVFEDADAFADAAESMFPDGCIVETGRAVYFFGRGRVYGGRSVEEMKLRLAVMGYSVAERPSWTARCRSLAYVFWKASSPEFAEAGRGG